MACCMHLTPGVVHNFPKTKDSPTPLSGSSAEFLLAFHTWSGPQLPKRPWVYGIFAPYTRKNPRICLKMSGEQSQECWSVSTMDGSILPKDCAEEMVTELNIRCLVKYMDSSYELVRKVTPLKGTRRQHCGQTSQNYQN